MHAQEVAMVMAMAVRATTTVSTTPDGPYRGRPVMAMLMPVYGGGGSIGSEQIRTRIDQVDVGKTRLCSSGRLDLGQWSPSGLAVGLQKK
jgi:hypothetical protein